MVGRTAHEKLGFCCLSKAINPDLGELVLGTRAQLLPGYCHSRALMAAASLPLPNKAGTAEGSGSQPRLPIGLTWTVFTMTHAWVPRPWDFICPGGRLVYGRQHAWSTEHYPSRNAEFAHWEHYMQFWGPLPSYTQHVLFGGDRGGCAICRNDPHSTWGSRQTVLSGDRWC